MFNQVELRAYKRELMFNKTSALNFKLNILIEPLAHPKNELQVQVPAHNSVACTSDRPRRCDVRNAKINTMLNQNLTPLGSYE